MTSLFRRCLTETEDWLRYQPTVRDCIGRYMCAFQRRTVPEDHNDRVLLIASLCGAARLVKSPGKIRQIEERILEHVAKVDLKKVDWPRFVANVESRLINRAVILK